MSSGEDLRLGRVIERTIACLLVFGGVMPILWPFGRGEGWTHRLVMIAVGLGLWRHWRWARWMTLGACFLAIAAALVIPAFLFLTRYAPNGNLGNSLVASFFALAFGALGYKGLSYLRSERARFDFAGSPAAHDKLFAERSSAVVYSAIVWVLLFIVSASPTLLSPTRWFQAAISEQRHSPTAAKRAKYVVLLREPLQVGGATIPDIIPLRLCVREQRRDRVIHIVYTNAGGNQPVGSFRFATGQDFDAPLSLRGPSYPVPYRDKLALAEYGLEKETRSGKLVVNFDVGNEVHEVDEANNAAQFMIHRRDDGGVNLPDCDAVQLKAISRDGPTITIATVRLPQLLPDLVPLGLCGRGQFDIGVQFTNRGAPAPRQFWISQGRTLNDLQVTKNHQHSVPPPNEARGFTLGSISELVGQPGASADVAAWIDQGDVIHESNELNNMVSARVTRLPNGTVDLPECDALAMRAADPDWLSDDVALQPAFVPLPDLVPLGLCIKDWGPDFRYFQIVYANIGNVSSPYAIRIALADAPKSNRPHLIEEFRVPGPGYVTMAGTLRKDDDPRASEIVTIDTTNVVAELFESNNTKTFEVARKRDGRADLPDCDSIHGRISEWTGNINSTAGPE